ncbi:GNAT family N-acetyltransferase [Phreatobacter sp.]|uniref:GNAT family N-acetyltransferase n=1 Tax=Phreatobacter sp. TaxID=1966341 RepID=UPI0022BECDC8|nr:GNAT family N-acetyltransferase [Phreatobacter sp.]MCZ8315640.1 GNAT family N-acetyltransferase [Phreatobacter sp.]
MGEIRIRQAVIDDAAAMADLLNAIIAKGGTTAHRTPFDIDRMIAEYVAPPRLIACHVAERDGAILGFQSLEWSDPDWAGANPRPADWALVATFVAIEGQGSGIGRRLFEATRQAARAAGVVMIDATIRRENAGGLAYYSRQGFVDYWSDDTVIAKSRAP